MFVVRSAIAVALLVGAIAPAGAQSPAALTVGARVRVQGDRATNDGVRRFQSNGVVVALDSAHLVLQPSPSLSAPDTIAFVGVRRLDVFAGTRSRSRSIWTGAVVGTVASTALWLVGKQTMRVEEPLDPNPRPLPPVVQKFRNAIPIAAVGGALIGAVIGVDHWVHVQVPGSVFPQAP